MRSRILAITCLTAIVAGGVFALSENDATADKIWAAAVLLVLIPLTLDVVRVLIKGRVGVDSIALLAMVTALVMGEYLAGVIVGLMLSGGGALEDWAANRSRLELKRLLEGAPRTANRVTGSAIETIDVALIRPGDTIAVPSGALIAADGIVLDEAAAIDESSLTGESIPVALQRGAPIRSGTVNVGDPFNFKATQTAENSAYGALIRLVRHAEENRAPFVRMADRYAALMLPVTIALGVSAWLLSGDDIRFLAVLVVATPCPLILAAPIAFIGGISRAARHGIIVKGGDAIESLGRTRSVVFDKTGTLTLGTPEIDHVVTADSWSEDDLLRLTASVDQLSAHVLAASLVRSVESRGIQLSLPENVAETPGEGIAGDVESRRVVAGSPAMLLAANVRGTEEFVERLESEHGIDRARVLVGIDGQVAGALLLSDHIREDASDLVPQLTQLGVRNVSMLTGDKGSVARAIADQAGIAEVRAGLDPDEKLKAIADLRKSPETSPVVMVGDGVNDAPALAMADVGVAMTSGGLTAAAEAADAVIVVDRVDRVVRAIEIGKHSLAIANQSVRFGLGLSFIAMVFAAFGYIPPVAGALLQEGIDVAVILNALRALRG